MFADLPGRELPEMLHDVRCRPVDGVLLGPARHLLEGPLRLAHEGRRLVQLAEGDECPASALLADVRERLLQLAESMPRETMSAMPPT